MRSFFLVLVCGLLAWAFLNFFPSSEPASATKPGAEVPAQGPTQPPEPAPEVVATPAPIDPRAESGQVTTQPATAPKASPFAAPPASGAAPVAPAVHSLAAGLAYGYPEDRLRVLLQAARPGLEANSANLADCFLDGLAGRIEACRSKATDLHERGQLAERDLSLVMLLLGIQAPNVTLPSVAATNPADALFLGLRLALSRELARRQTSQNQLNQANARYTELIRGLIDAPWPVDAVAIEGYCAELRQMQRSYRWNPRADWAGIEVEVQRGDSLIALRKRLEAEHPGLRLTAEVIARFNGLGNSMLQPGMKLRVPLEPISVLVDVDKRWLLYFVGEQLVDAWQVGVGKEGEETLLGEFVIGNKQKEPMYFPRGQNPVPFGSKDNPLGTRWLGWRVPGADGDLSYGFHGTWEPETIGQAASQGCVRMTNENVELLAELLPVGAKVIVRA
jgi:hypothetical protein